MNGGWTPARYKFKNKYVWQEVQHYYKDNNMIGTIYRENRDNVVTGWFIQSYLCKTPYGTLGPYSSKETAIAIFDLLL